MQKLFVDGVEYRFFDHLYAVSKAGTFLRHLKPYEPNKTRKDGYLSVGRQRLAHRMVATCWVVNISGGKHVHHINGNKSDNRAENLEWVTPKHHITICHNTPSRGHFMTDAGKQRLRELRTGTKHSEATKQKIREASIKSGTRPPVIYGYKHSEETKKKMSANHGKRVKCIVYGVVYQSFKLAGDAIGEHLMSVRRKCHSRKFPEFQIA